ncbi:MAG: hypothetical protein JWN25_993, partial [Verrucomicrobiales bacterium]|nr:hypothetical protein [Verrucomicrobiales bacterium]
MEASCEGNWSQGLAGFERRYGIDAVLFLDVFHGVADDVTHFVVEKGLS